MIFGYDLVRFIVKWLRRLGRGLLGVEIIGLVKIYVGDEDSYMNIMFFIRSIFFCYNCYCLRIVFFN